MLRPTRLHRLRFFWITFYDRANQSASVRGAQLVECATTQCDRPILLMATGVCTGEDCLKAQPILSAPHRFDCAENICLYAESQFSKHSNGPFYKLVAQFNDRSRTSSAFALDLRNPLGGYPKKCG
ncbi:MAG: hypothetical protein HC780_23895 [Leptolyngbyaceae cyanobacterium CSU_1_3]|nr:hypothetical protein [Leptolyngbyaceae cyanobacterium CSU_1_3]